VARGRRAPARLMLRRRDGRSRAAPGRASQRIDRVAFLGPFPPAATGVATYDRAVVDGLDRIGVTPRVEPLWPVEDRHATLVPAYRLAIYQLGNNLEFHRAIYRIAWHVPGVVVLHDLALDDFVRGLAAAGDPLAHPAAREALEAAERVPDELRADEPLRLPWCAAIARRSRGIVVHSSFARDYLERIGCRSPVFVVPHPPPETAGAIASAERRGARIRAEAAARGARALVVAPGDMNEAKQLDALVRAVASLDPGVHLALVGRRIPTYDMRAVVRAAALGGRLRVEQDVGDDDFLGWLHAADIVVDLRFPHRGEVSGSLARAMQVGRPTIVSATGTYLDAPTGSVLYVDPGPARPDQLADRIRTLAEDEGLRRRIGETARTHMEGLRSTDATARGYAEAIAATLRAREDVTADVLERWARALVQIGVTQEHLDAGYGLGYARALQSFKRSPSSAPGGDEVPC
jgi:glycosyltransferase involved in cell wall biosynthesis